MKKTFIAVALVSFLTFGLASCGGEQYDDTLVVYNWEDYIDDGKDEDGNYDHESVIEIFEKEYLEETGRTIKVEYQTFSTNEDMYNMMKLGSLKADLICPSDYMIQKMAREDMLEKFSFDTSTHKYGDDLDNYNKYASPYLKNLFERNSFSSYAIPYTWGTMGLTYNYSAIEDNNIDLTTWDCLWDSALKGKVTVKDSVRDTYFTAVMHVYKSELVSLKNMLENGEMTKESYTEAITEIFNRCDDETLEKCKQALIDLKSNIKALEVDDGKNDITTGSLYANLAWSGDAVYSMDIADEVGKVQLNYIIPEEGSNIWFDGWCMPKGANVDLATKFTNFLSRPDIAAKNMNFTGYTSSIAGDEIFDLATEWYSAEEGDENVDEVDLSYFFEGTLSEGKEAIFLISKDERGRQFDAQYPDEDTISRCAIMKDFGVQTDKLNAMWSDFKNSF